MNAHLYDLNCFGCDRVYIEPITYADVVMKIPA